MNKLLIFIGVVIIIILFIQMKKTKEGATNYSTYCSNKYDNVRGGIVKCSNDKKCTYNLIKGCLPLCQKLNRSDCAITTKCRWNTTKDKCFRRK